MIARSLLESRVLILAPSGRDAQLTKYLLEESSIETYICSDMPDLFSQIEQGAGAVLLASEVLTRPMIEQLSRLLDRQPAWSDLSNIIITGAGTGMARGSQLRELGVLTNATILERPVRAATIVNSVKVALRARSRQYVMRDHLVERTRLEMQLADAYHRQHRIAETLQRSMLNHPSKESFTGLQISTLYVAAKDEAEVGGDFFDVFSLNDDSIAIVVGDVSGKGLEAASRSLEVKYPLRAFLRRNPSPGIALSELNRYLTDAQRLDQPADGGFVCICICHVDTNRRTLTWSSAAFEGPLLMSFDGKCDVLQCSGPPVGVLETQEYEDSTRNFDADDTVVIFTDGITESRKGRAFFGIEGVIESLHETSSFELSTIVQQIAGSAADYSGGEAGDDVCVVALRLAGAAKVV